jgi:hypothetical protein
MSKERAAKQEAARRETGNAEGPKTKQSARKGGKEGPAEESAVAAGRTLQAPAITRPGPHESGLKGAPGANGLEFDAESSAGEPLPESSKADVLSGDRFSAQVPQNMAEGELREKGRSGESGTEHGGVYQNRSGGASAGAGQGRSGFMLSEKRPQEAPSTYSPGQVEIELQEQDDRIRAESAPRAAASAPKAPSEDAIRCEQEALSEAVKLAVTGRCQEASARLVACDETNPDTRALCRAWLELARCFLGKHDLERARQMATKAAGIPACADEAGSLLREIEKLPGTP